MKFSSYINVMIVGDVSSKACNLNPSLPVPSLHLGMEEKKKFY